VAGSNFGAHLRTITLQTAIEACAGDAAIVVHSPASWLCHMRSYQSGQLSPSPSYKAIQHDQQKLEHIFCGDARRYKPLVEDMTGQPAEGKRDPILARTPSRKRFLRLSAVGLAGTALAGVIGFTLVRDEGENTADASGISPDNTPGENRTGLLKALTNSAESIAFPPGDYLIDNSGTPIVVRNFSGQLTMEPGARFIFTDDTAKGLHFEGGTGAEIDGLRTTFETLPSSRVSARECIQFIDATDTIVQNASINGSAAAGLLFGRCIRPSAEGVVIENTMADGLHFANCKDARANDILTRNTGDDGLAFLNYASGPDYTGGQANNISVENSGARGITVLGQRGVTVEDFRVDTTYASSILVAHDTYWDTRVPSAVRFAHGTVKDAGKGSRGTWASAGNSFGIEYTNVEGSAEFEDIVITSPVAEAIGGIAPHGTVLFDNVRLQNVRLENREA
jgi:preprotein translocase subunit Sss1